MKGSRLKWFYFLLFSLFLLISCSGAKISTNYADEAFTGNVSNFLIIAQTGSPHHQRIFEKEFVSRVKSIGAEAVASSEVMEMPSDLALTKEMILDAIRQYENDAVIITRMVGRKDKDRYRLVRSYDKGFYDFYLTGHGYFNSQVTVSSKTSVFLETNLYDVKTEKLIWSGITKTKKPDPKRRDPEDGEALRNVVKALVKKLGNSRLISQ